MTIECPNCRSTRLNSKTIPEHRREWMDGGESFTEHMPETVDYECKDCGCEFNIICWGEQA